MLSALTSLISLPLPLLSFLALPFFGGSTASINFVLFYLTWSTLVLTHDGLKLEIYGTLVVRVLAFLAPALLALAVDCGLPSLAVNVKAQGRKQLPSRLGAKRVLRMTAWSIGNICLGVALQAAIELVLVKGFRTGPSLVVSTFVPLPWTIGKHLLAGYAIRGVVHYCLHRYVLHASSQTSSRSRARSEPRAYTNQLSRWHANWAHSTPFTFSVMAAYDHPVCYIVAQCLPTYLAAVYLRMHVLTWLSFITLLSLESVFVYSGYGYAVLPSAIVLPGMARRIDAHYETRGRGNYGHLGLMDWLCGTSCATEEADFGDDMQDEVEKHHVQRRFSDAVEDASGFIDDARGRIRASQKKKKKKKAMEAAVVEEDGQSDALSTPRSATKRRSQGARS